MAFFTLPLGLVLDGSGSQNGPPLARIRMRWWMWIIVLQEDQEHEPGVTSSQKKQTAHKHSVLGTSHAVAEGKNKDSYRSQISITAQ